MANESETIYCSLDLEFTGFDPSKDQILEVAFILFRATEAGFEVIERWSSLFRPSVPVPEKVLGLTHLTMADLEVAPQFADHAAFLQQKLANVVFVGHNLTLDLKFLEAFGVQLSTARVIDTLDLVQWLLPTYHSYNLENITRFLGVVHKDAHRALADCEATVGVLEKLLAHFRTFPTTVQTQLLDVLARAFPALPGLLSTSGPSVAITTIGFEELTEVPTWPHITSFPVVISSQNSALSPVAVAQSVITATTDALPLIVLPHQSMVLEAWRRGLGYPVLTAEQCVDSHRVHSFIATAQSPVEVIFAAKLLVWQATNWQTVSHIDLNTSFTGHQFITAISASVTPGIPQETKALLVDYGRAITLSADIANAVTSVIVLDVVRFEQWLSQHGGHAWSWQRILGLLKALYDPERAFPYENPLSLAQKTLVTDALAATDLFFGLLHLELKPWQHVGLAPVSDIGQSPYRFKRLSNAAHTLSQRLHGVAAVFPDSGLQAAIAYLQDFFTLSDDPVRWIDFGQRHTVLMSRQVELSLGGLTAAFAHVPTTFVDFVGHNTALSYALERLHQPVLPVLPWLSSNKDSIVSETITSGLINDAISELLTAGKAVVVLFPTVEAVKDYYDAHYEVLGKLTQVWAQGYSGGQNKILRNFSAVSGGLLLATAEFLAKQYLPVPADCLVLFHTDTVLVDDPYTRAVLQRYKTNFSDLPQTWHATMLQQAMQTLSGLQKVIKVQDL